MRNEVTAINNPKSQLLALLLLLSLSFLSGASSAGGSLFVHLSPRCCLPENFEQSTRAKKKKRSGGAVQSKLKFIPALFHFPLFFIFFHTFEAHAVVFTIRKQGTRHSPPIYSLCPKVKLCTRTAQRDKKKAPTVKCGCEGERRKKNNNWLGNQERRR